MMMGRPYRPLRELEDHLDRGELEFALALAHSLADERERPLELELVLRFLPLIAVARPAAFDPWTLRWLERWCDENRVLSSIDDAFEVVGGLAEIPADPERGLERIRAASKAHPGLSSWRRRRSRRD
jgi:hypothetical protein